MGKAVCRQIGAEAVVEVEAEPVGSELSKTT